MTGPAPARRGSGIINLAVDYGPILIFFGIYRYYAPADHESLAEVAAVIRATGAFMVAAVIALIVSKWKLGKISPMLMLSTALIVGFGALTIAFQDKLWIQIKPTVIYLFFGVTLIIGVMRGVPLLRTLLQAAFDGLDDAGWMKLSRNWGWFFLALAGLNEVLRHTMDFGDWIAAKLWVFMPLTFLFTFTQLPMLMRHGLGEDRARDVLSDPPHE